MGFRLLKINGTPFPQQISKRKARKFRSRGVVKKITRKTLQITCAKFEKECVEALPNFHVGNGWNYERGMSNNAVKAYAEGKVPISRVTRKRLDEYDINLTVREAKERFRRIGACEYHHTSKYARRTDFYDLSELKAEKENRKTFVLELGLKFAIAYHEQIYDEDNVGMGPSYLSSLIWDVWRGLPVNPDDPKTLISTLLRLDTKMQIQLWKDTRISELPKSKQDKLYAKCVDKMRSVIKSLPDTPQNRESETETPI